MCYICKERSKINYFLRLQNGVWLAKLSFYTKNKFYQGLQAVLVELKCLTVAKLSCMFLAKYHKETNISHKLPTLNI